MKRMFSSILVFFVFISYMFCTTFVYAAGMPTSIAMTTKQLMSVSLKGLGLFGLVSQMADTQKEIIFNGVQIAKWCQGVTSSGEYGLSIPQADLNKMYNNFLQAVPYGTKLLSTNVESLKSYYIPKSQLIIRNTDMIAYAKAYASQQGMSYYFIKSSSPMNAGDGVCLISSNQPITLHFASDTSTTFKPDTNLTTATYIFYNDVGEMQFRVDNNYSSIKPNFNENYSVWFVNHDLTFTKFNGDFVGTLGNDIVIPQEVWNVNYITNNGVNYDKWATQPNGNVVVKIPVSDVAGVPTYDVNLLKNLTTDVARISDSLVEIQEKPIVDINPYSPTVPVTQPVTNPLAETVGDTFLDRLWNKFIDLWLLPDNYFSDYFKIIGAAFPTQTFAFQIVADLGSLGHGTAGTLQDIHVNLMGQDHIIVNFQSLRNILPTVHNWVRGLMFVFLLFYNYDQIYKLIRGSSYGFANGLMTRLSAGDFQPHPVEKKGKGK